MLGWDNETLLQHYDASYCSLIGLSSWKSKDARINPVGWRLLQLMIKLNMKILHESMFTDPESKLTFWGSRGIFALDYVLISNGFASYYKYLCIFPLLVYDWIMIDWLTWIFPTSKWSPISSRSFSINLIECSQVYKPLIPLMPTVGIPKTLCYSGWFPFVGSQLLVGCFWGLPGMPFCFSSSFSCSSLVLFLFISVVLPLYCFGVLWSFGVGWHLSE